MRVSNSKKVTTLLIASVLVVGSFFLPIFEALSQVIHTEPPIGYNHNSPNLTTPSIPPIEHNDISPDLTTPSIPPIHNYDSPDLTTPSIPPIEQTLPLSENSQVYKHIHKTPQGTWAPDVGCHWLNENPNDLRVVCKNN